MAKAQQKQNTIHVKTGDRVVVITGKDKGKIGNVKKVITSTNKLIVEGINMVTKAVKPNPMAGVQGGLTKMEAPIASSNVMICCPKTEKPTRIRREINKDGKKTRVCKISGEQLDA